MSDPRPTEAMLDLIYGAAAQPALWGQVLQQMADATSSTCAFWTDLNILSGEGSVPYITDPTSLQLYFDHYAGINPIQLVDDPDSYLSNWSPKVLRDEDCIERGRFEHTEYFTDFCRPLDCTWSLMIRLNLSGLNVAAINLARSPRQGRFEAGDIAYASRLQADLIRASKLSCGFAGLKELNAGLVAALDDAVSATLLLDRSGRIVHANGAAEALLAKGDPVCAAGGRLSAAEPEVAREIAAKVAAAAAEGWEERRGSRLRLRARSGPATLGLSIAPLRPQDGLELAHGPAVLVAIAAEPDGDAAHRELEPFGLTPAELRLALALRDGLSLREASERFRLSTSTVRNQLASVFSKTGTHRQAELVRLLIGAGRGGG